VQSAAVYGMETVQLTPISTALASSS